MICIIRINPCIVEITQFIRTKLNIAYMLMLLGFYGLLFEVTHPGIGVPGILGAIFLILAFFSLQTLPTNFAGLALIILGIMLFAAEVFVPGFGLPTLGGLVCLFLGSIFLFDTSSELMQVSFPLIAGFSLGTAAITIFLIRAVIVSQRQRSQSGMEGMIDAPGVARTDLEPGKEGKIFVHGELWNAVSQVSIRKGDQVTVIGADAMVLKVKKSS